LGTGLVNLTGGAHGTLANLTASNSNVYTGLTSFLGSDDTAHSGYPKAYINWIFLDDQFNYVSSLSGSVLAASSTYPGNQMNLVAPGSQIALNRNGYLYIWVSNETSGWDVFFDDFSVQYKQGPLLEENHYYPFGLTMAGISDKAVKTNYAENKYRFQKQELQNKEFSDGSGLEMYEFKYRFDDCQIGRFWSIDPLADKYEYNSPYAFSEDKVTGHVELEGLEAVEVVEGLEEAAPEIGHAIAAAVTATGVWLSSIQASPGSTSISGGSMYAVPLGNNAAMNMSQPAPAAIPLTTAGQDAVNSMNVGLGLSPAQGVTPTAPLASTTVQANSNQGSEEGRGKNDRKPDPEATGDHTVSNDRGSTTYQKNDKNPSGFQEVKRVDTKGGDHGGVPVPHVHEGGKVRPANPDEIPKVDLNKNKPPTGN